MADQATVDQWLGEFLQRLRKTFGGRLVFVGHHGSWARGDATPDSDIDTMVVLDHIASSDLAAYRAVIDAMPDGGRDASGLLNSVAEMRALPRSGLTQCFYGCQVLHGAIDGIVERPTADDLLADILIMASDNLTSARHYLLFPHDLSAKVHGLRYRFKRCLYALQEWLLVRQGEFLARKDQLLEALTDEDDRAVVAVVRDWPQTEADRTARPRHYIELLERWSRGMLARVQECRPGSRDLVDS